MSKKGTILGYIFFALIVVMLYFFLQNGSLNVSPAEVEQKAEEIGEKISQEIQGFTIKEGDGLSEIGGKLKEQGLIKNVLLFKIYAILNRVKDDFWPGEYDLSAGLNLKDLVDVLTGTPRAQEKTVTIIEGTTNAEIKEIFKEQGLVKDDFFTALEEAGKDPELLAKYDFLATDADPEEQAWLQGYLFPDTYRFYQETTPRAVIEKMLDNFNQKLDAEIRKKIKESGHTIQEAITMASLIEKEAALEQDRRLVSDIFWRRLKEGWALESCATVNYILGSSKERLSYDDTRISSAYNTYLHRGLPPGPINNPGLVSIQAAVEPLQNDYCCFLSTDEGKMIFSRTITEHNWNKELYLK